MGNGSVQKLHFLALCFETLLTISRQTRNIEGSYFAQGIRTQERVSPVKSCFKSPYLGVSSKRQYLVTVH